MSFIHQDEEVWLVDEDDGAHVGTVKSIIGKRVLVNFDDWEEEFNEDDFIFHPVWEECRDVLKATRRGVIVTKYRS